MANSLCFARTRGLVLAALLFLCQSAQAAVIGNPAIDRSASDSWSDFVLGLTSEVFATAGTVTNWNVYTNNAGTLGMLLLRNTGGTNYMVVGADFENAAAGLNSFVFAADTGVANVVAGDILGLYIGSAKVDFDYSGPDSVQWCGNSGCISNVNIDLVAGQTVVLTGGPQARIYSANVTVPEPASLALLGLGLFGLGFSRRKKA